MEGPTEAIKRDAFRIDLDLTTLMIRKVLLSLSHLLSDTTTIARSGYRYIQSISSESMTRRSSALDLVSHISCNTRASTHSPPLSRSC